MDLTIRPIAIADAAAVIAMLNPIILDGRYTSLVCPLSVMDEVEFIRSLPPNSICHVAVESKTKVVVGIQDVLPQVVDFAATDVGEISTFVSLDFHRCGIGQRLSLKTFSAAKELGYKKLLATIRSDNSRAIEFYQSLGFRNLTTRVDPVIIGGITVYRCCADRDL